MKGEQTRDEYEEWNDEGSFSVRAKIFAKQLGRRQIRVLVFQASECLHIRGAVDVRVLFGELECFGSIVRNSYQSIISPQGTGLHSLRSGEEWPSSTIEDWYRTGADSRSDFWTEEDRALNMDEFVRSVLSSATQEVKKSIVALAIVKSCDSFPKIEVLSKDILEKVPQRTDLETILELETATLIPKLEPPDGKPMKIPAVWRKIVNDWNTQSFPEISMQCGKKHVGKSTLMRFLVNVLWSKFGKVAVLDCDLGQPELTAPGLISLSVVDSPMLGPPFSNMHLSHCCFQELHWIGTASAKEKLSDIFSACLQLFARFKHSQEAHFKLDNGSNIPLVINTHGWIEGQGQVMLEHMVSTLRPQTLIQIVPRGDPSIINYEQCLAMNIELISLEPAVVHLSYATIKSTEKRVQQIRSALSTSSRPVYCLPWAAFRIHVLDAEIPFSQIMYILNASIVALVVDYTDYVSTFDIASNSDSESPRASFYTSDRDAVDTTLPRFLLEPPPMVSSRCVGIGLITSIDMDRRTFYIATLVPPSQLAEVNTLVKGQIELPSAVLMEGAIPGSPYLTADSVSSMGSGSGTLRVRNNIVRGSNGR
jgi:hypothetical protein